MPITCSRHLTNEVEGRVEDALNLDGNGIGIGLARYGGRRTNREGTAGGVEEHAEQLIVRNQA